MAAAPEAVAAAAVPVAAGGAVLSGSSAGGGEPFIALQRKPTAQGVPLALDIGGSLAKVAYFQVHRKRTASFREPAGDGVAAKPELYDVEDGEEEEGRLHLKVFLTKNIDACIDFVRGLAPGAQVGATGGGAHKFADRLQKELSIELRRLDEMQCLVDGCNFVLGSIPNAAFACEGGSRKYRTLSEPVFPYLLVNIGSGVSILQVNGPGEFERVDGSAVGGGTFWGLCSLLTQTNKFDGIVDLAATGNSSNVDMLVRDIYGNTTPASLGLNGDITASSFGKAARAKEPGAAPASEADIARSLLEMISYNIGQISCLNARLLGLKRIHFAGFFLREQPAVMEALTFAVQYWGKGNVQALFLRHEGYLGAVGAFLAAHGDAGSHFKAASWDENFADSADSDGVFRQLTLEQRTKQLVFFSLLQNPAEYTADEINLSEDAEARRFWIDRLKNGIPKVVSRARQSDSLVDTASQRAEAFGQTFGELLDALAENPGAYGQLSVRVMVDIREQCLREFRFPDCYAATKKEENQAALEILPQLLASNDKLEAGPRMRAVVEGVLAGNSFDWGAKATTDRLEAGSLDFAEERKRVRNNQWLVDDYELWTEHWDAKAFHKAVVLVDNCGADIVLGVFPFVRELLAGGLQVVLGANSLPALNDVTAEELKLLARSIGALDPAVRTALDNGSLVVHETGTSSPCLDFLRVDRDFAALCADADLLVIEGMGRAIHTNFSAKFKCSTLKLAMIKSEWVANRHGGHLYDVVCRFEPSRQDPTPAAK